MTRHAFERSKRLARRGRRLRLARGNSPTQLEAWLLPSAARSSADIGPRFVQRIGERLDADLDRKHHWLLAGAFHFGYAAWWGVLYALLQRWRPAQPHVGGPLLAALIYGLAFSPWGAATQTGTETPVETRPTWSTLLHWTAALSFSLSLAYLYDRLHRPLRPVLAATHVVRTRLHA